ncbi:hypothetical protein [Reichenbachiella sp. MALMAid0571]|uniref:hypothetical protein n=1 Tax=Reichenbachiella sp. MALMAid0571 TaxID=3143939 RepID=UPI0032DF33E6
MFGLFKSKAKKSNLTYYVYLTKITLYRQLMATVQEDMNNQKELFIAYYFDDTGKELASLLEAADLKFNVLGSMEENTSGITIGKAESLIKSSKNTFEVNAYSMILVCEIHPLAGVDIALYDYLTEKYGGAILRFYTSIDSPILRMFGADRIIQLLKTMGMEENEMIEHSMVTKSILRAQEKIKEQVIHEKDAHSIEEWMEKNTPDFGGN